MDKKELKIMEKVRDKIFKAKEQTKQPIVFTKRMCEICHKDEYGFICLKCLKEREALEQSRTDKSGHGNLE